MLQGSLPLDTVALQVLHWRDCFDFATALFLLFIYFGVIEDTPASKRIKLAGLTAVVAAPFQSADTSDVKKSSSCFSKKEICVLNGSDSLTKQELERKVVSGGGTVVQNPGK